MTRSVIHLPGVVRDGAHAFVTAAGHDDFIVFADLVARRLGSETHNDLAATRERLLGARVGEITDEWAVHTEIGIWRAKLDDLLRQCPDLTEPVRELTAQAPGIDGPEPTGRN
ncbi:MAG TPA: hypothetical protein VFO77_04945 [Actinoplanes sp.]|nr:hypothetical protein [Actinoplanes sp.]